MDNETCKTCVHFHQHYVLSESRFLRIYCGHCTFLKPKTRRPLSKACEHYAFGPSDEDAFATKKYLSKELVKYLMSLELLPEIEDAPE